MTEKNIITEETKAYWRAAIAVIDAAGSYSGAIKLRANLMDDSTRFKVKHVLDGSFKGKMENLDDAISCREKLFYAKVEKLNILCKEHGIMLITKPDKLLGLLLDSKRRESYRKKAKRRLAKNRICPLQDFELGKR